MAIVIPSASEPWALGPIPGSSQARAPRRGRSGGSSRRRTRLPPVRWRGRP